MSTVFTIRRIYYIAIILILGFLYETPYFVQATNLVAVDTKTEIEQRNKELADIQKKILENQQKLTETQQQKQTISSELKKIDTTIKQADLGITASQITVQKLDVEIDSLHEDIISAEKDLAEKGNAVGELFKQMQVSDQENLLISFIRSDSLSDGLQMMQGLVELNQTLLVKIQELQDSHTTLTTVLNSTAKKKTDKELEQENLKNRKLIAAELKQEKNQVLKDTKVKEASYQESLKELEKRQAEIAAEIDALEAPLRDKIDYKDLPKTGSGILGIPLTDPHITQEQGRTASAKKLYKSGYHNGMDFGAPVGTPLFSTYEGTIVSVANQDLFCRKGAYGKYIAIKHPIGLTTLYAHLSLQVVKEGDSVKKGQLIGYSGNTGYSTGPHLHFGVYDSSTFYIGPSKSCGPQMPFGGDLNPRNYLSL
ncbi:MAG: peptidoglycan DD-metalloendopeptidase family protein [Candidatus Paceibacterota bacterium]